MRAKRPKRFKQFNEYIIYVRYLGGPVDEGGFDLEVRVKCDTNVAFEWRALGAGFDEKLVAIIRCNSAVQRSIQFPEQWRTALK